METNGSLSTTLSILSAMLAPAILISACGSLTISTANRMGRSVDRVRRLSDELRALVEASTRDLDTDERILFVYDQIEQSTRRTRLLHRALTSLYAALGTFVATSVSIGIVIAADEQLSWLPTAIIGVGVSLLFFACLLLIRETGIARRAIDHELDFILALERRHTPPELLAQRAAAMPSLTWRDRLPFRRS